MPTFFMAVKDYRSLKTSGRYHKGGRIGRLPATIDRVDGYRTLLQQTKAKGRLKTNVFRRPFALNAIELRRFFLKRGICFM